MLNDHWCYNHKLYHISCCIWDLIWDVAIWFPLDISKYLGIWPTVDAASYDPGPGSKVFLILVYFIWVPNPTSTPSSLLVRSSYSPGPGNRWALPTPRSERTLVPITCATFWWCMGATSVSYSPGPGMSKFLLPRAPVLIPIWNLGLSWAASKSVLRE